MDNGKQALGIIRGMQKLNGEISSLIKTFDRVMADKGYRNDGSNAVIKDISTLLDNSELWVPPYMFRSLKHKTNKDDVFNLNIVLDDPTESERVQEPLFLCARFQYSKSMAKKYASEWDVWDLWFSHPVKQLNHYYSIDELQLKSSEFLEDSQWGKECLENIQQVNCIGVPLMSITDTKVLVGIVNHFIP